MLSSRDVDDKYHHHRRLLLSFVKRGESEGKSGHFGDVSSSEGKPTSSSAGFASQLFRDQEFGVSSALSGSGATGTILRGLGLGLGLGLVLRVRVKV